MATADDVMHVNVLAGGDIGGRYPHGLSIFNDLATPVSYTHLTLPTTERV